MTNTDTDERKDFNDFLIGDATPDDSPEYNAFMADVSPELANFDFSDLMVD
jgi:hypothetical protein